MNVQRLGMNEIFLTQVDLKVMLLYLRSFGFVCMVCILVCFAGQVGFDLSSNIWLSLWSNDMSAEGTNATVMDPDLRVAVYGVIGGAQSG